MICKYFADDGTEFDNYDECETYERRKKTIYSITLSRFWNRNRKPMTLEEFIHEPADCDYMEVADAQAAAIIKDFFRYDAGIVTPWAYSDTPLAGSLLL